MDEKPLHGTMDYYRKRAETDPEIAELVELIDRLSDQLVIAVSAVIGK